MSEETPINHASPWHDDPINIRIAARRMFHAEKWCRRIIYGPSGQGQQKSHLSSCFRVTFSELKSGTSCRSYQGWREFIVMFEFDAITMMCLFILLSLLDDRLEVSTWRLRFHFRSQLVTDAHTNFYDVFVSLAHRTEFCFGSFRSTICKSR